MQYPQKKKKEEATKSLDSRNYLDPNWELIHPMKWFNPMAIISSLPIDSLYRDPPPEMQEINSISTEKGSEVTKPLDSHYQDPNWKLIYPMKWFNPMAICRSTNIAAGPGPTQKAHDQEAQTSNMATPMCGIS